MTLLAVAMIFGPGVGIACGFFLGRAWQIQVDIKKEFGKCIKK